MKIKIDFTVEVDQEAWALEYGIPPAEVRRDVRQYIEDGARQFLAEYADETK